MQSPIIDALYRATRTDLHLGLHLCDRLMELCDTATANHTRYEEALTALVAVFNRYAKEGGYEPMETGVELLLRITGKGNEIA
jgi:hypothetical protein